MTGVRAYARDDTGDGSGIWGASRVTHGVDGR